MKRFLKVVAWAAQFSAVTLLLTSCLGDDDSVAPDAGSEPEFIFSYNFSSGIGEWETGFAEYPLSAEDTMQIDVDIISAPPELGAGDSLLRLAAIDPVGDLFSFIKLKITGLPAESNFTVLVETEFATLNFDTLGTVYDGDLPVHVKAGIFETDPLLVASEDSLSVGYAFNEFDIDKGNNADAGADMVLLGTLNMPEPQVFTSILRANNNGRELSGSTDADGNMWLLIGTDSEAKMHQAFYYSRVAVLFDELD